MLQGSSFASSCPTLDVAEAEELKRSIFTTRPLLRVRQNGA